MKDKRNDVVCGHVAALYRVWLSASPQPTLQARVWLLS